MLEKRFVHACVYTRPAVIYFHTLPQRAQRFFYRLPFLTCPQEVLCLSVSEREKEIEIGHSLCFSRKVITVGFVIRAGFSFSRHAAFSLHTALTAFVFDLICYGLCWVNALMKVCSFTSTVLTTGSKTLATVKCWGWEEKLLAGPTNANTRSGTKHWVINYFCYTQKKKKIQTTQGCWIKCWPIL